MSEHIISIVILSLFFILFGVITTIVGYVFYRVFEKLGCEDVLRHDD